jgi:hypothetical protein
MQNFNDILNGVSDGSKDLSINALTVAGAASFNGAVTLGNATGDDITFTGLVASDIDPKTAATYALGSSTLPWQSINIDNGATDGGAVYFGGTTTDFLKSSVDGEDLDVGGFSALDLTAGCIVKSLVSTRSKTQGDLTITDTDGISVLLCTAESGADLTITLPTAADNDGRKLTIMKVDAGTAGVVIDGEGSETINGYTSTTLGAYSDAAATGQYARMTIVCDGSNWIVVETAADVVRSEASGSWGTSNTYTDLTSVTLPAGKWMVSSSVYVIKASSTLTNVMFGAVTTYSGNDATNVTYDGGLCYYESETYPTATASVNLEGTTEVVTTTAEDVYYLKGRLGWSSSAPNYKCKLEFVRIG